MEPRNLVFSRKVGLFLALATVAATALVWLAAGGEAAIVVPVALSLPFASMAVLDSIAGDDAMTHGGAH